MTRWTRPKGKSRGVVITPLGYRILAAVVAGTYQFAPTLGDTLKAGRTGIAMHKGKRRAKFRGNQ